jgi:Holliday junction resolvase
MAFYITKSSGEKELFDLHKFRASLHQAGAREPLIETIIHEIKRIHPKTTKAIHAIAFTLLQEQEAHIAARYNLRRAIIELGPAGFSFEQFVAQILKSEGYSTQTDVIVPGSCVEHEVDVIAQKDDAKIMVECKFHHSMGVKVDVKVVLYVQARFEDIQKQDSFTQPWLFTNTKFTSEAITYADCKNMRLTGWSYPAGNNLAHLIDKFGLHPITALTTLTHRQKNDLINNGLILCRDIEKYIYVLKNFGLSEHAIDTIVKEAHAVSKVRTN